MCHRRWDITVLLPVRVCHVDNARTWLLTPRYSPLLCGE